MLDFCEKNSVGVIICYFSSDTFIAVAFQGGPKRFNPKQYQFLSLISITLTFEKKNHLSNYRLTASLETKIPTKLKLFSLIWYWIGVLIVCLYWFTVCLKFELWNIRVLPHTPLTTHIFLLIATEKKLFFPMTTQHSFSFAIRFYIYAIEKVITLAIVSVNEITKFEWTSQKSGGCRIQN